MSLIKHFTTSSWNLLVAFSSPVTVAGGATSNLNSALNEFVRGQCSSTFSIKTFRAFTSAAPSCISHALGSNKRKSKTPITRFSLSKPTRCARTGVWNTCISAFRTYRHARAVDGPGAARAASKMEETLFASWNTNASASGAIAVSAASSPAEPMTS